MYPRLSNSHCLKLNKNKMSHAMVKGSSILYNAVLIYNYPKEEGFRKHCEKRRNAGNQHFLLFPKVFSTLSKREIVVLATFNFVDCECFQFGHAGNVIVWYRVNAPL